jgi:hypothetical protein
VQLAARLLRFSPLSLLLLADGFCPLVIITHRRLGLFRRVVLRARRAARTFF